MKAAKGSPDYVKEKGASIDMYDLMPPFPSASKPLDSGKEGLNGGSGKTTGRHVAPKNTPKLNEHKKAYGRGHPAKDAPIQTVDDIRKRRRKLKADK